jgi:hypothetical protein
VTGDYQRRQAAAVTTNRHSLGVTIFNAEVAIPTIFLFLWFTMGESHYWSERAISEIEQAALLVVETVITEIALNGGPNAKLLLS